MNDAHAAVADVLAKGSDQEALADAAAALLASPWWLPRLLAPALDALARDPWHDPPMRARRDPRRTSLVLAEDDRAALTAGVVHRTEPDATVVVSGRLAVVRYHRAGGALLHAWDAGPIEDDGGTLAPLATAALADGEVRSLDGRRHGHAVEAARGPVVTLTVAPRRGGLARAYDRATGRRMQVADGDPGASRRRMLLTLLRASGRSDAGAQFDAATRAEAHHLRWAAMREWLALDLAAALPRLRELADDPHPEVRAAARATLPRAEAHGCPA